MIADNIAQPVDNQIANQTLLTSQLNKDFFIKLAAIYCICHLLIFVSIEITLQSK